MLCQWRKYTALFLLIVLSVFIVPKELLHAFSGHTDTEHHEVLDDPGSVSLEVQHQHCALLKLEAPVYIPQLDLLSFASHAITFHYPATDYLHHSSASQGLALLRGPPARCA